MSDRTWKIKQTKETQGIFDLVIEMNLIKTQLAQLNEKEGKLKTELNYKKMKAFEAIENQIGVHDKNLRINTKDFDLGSTTLEVSEISDEENPFSALKKLFGE